MMDRRHDVSTLRLLHEQSLHTRDNAQVAHQAAVQQWQGTQAQLQSLMDYRSEQDARWRDRFAHGGQVALLQCHQQFSERLEDAIQQQQRVVAAAKSVTEQRHLDLVEAEIRVASVARLIEKRLAEQRLVASRQEQRASDEFASRMSRQKQLEAGDDQLMLS